MVNDLKRNLAAEAGMNGRSGNMHTHAQPSLPASSFHSGCQLAANRKMNVFQGAHEHECTWINRNQSLWIESKRPGQIK